MDILDDIEIKIESERILWIEDHDEFAQKNKVVMEKKYLEFFDTKIEINVATNYEEAVRKLKKNKYKLALVDIEMEPENGFLVMKKINTDFPDTEFIIVSANLKQHKWSEALQSKKFKDTLHFEKPFSLAQSPQYKLMLETIKDKLNLHSDGDENETNPFNFTFKEFVKLPDKTLNELFETASEINKEFTEKYFKEHPDIDWIVIAKKPENIIASGESKNMPYEENLMDLAKKVNGPVFTYGRPIFIE